ncbi:ABC transporter substrate-binding protein [Ancylobacter radicis]|uniref:ABC transporter substrate-binding protein n=1 Tax=Ancylobacter radicis TaxID=2836179 RepID=A0ABS5R9V0_9HYPH|nr:ABC transporter substrate-binding protein [Ancylobacter radicis]MBS9478451.1 ABC transporter substrate-binding protein [Ancylobacter radicis]
MVAPGALDRRGFCGALVIGGWLGALPGPTRAAGDAPIMLTDMAGRPVRLSAPPTRIILLEARDILTMAALHPDPAGLVVGWAAAERIDSPQLQQRLQGRHAIAPVGRLTADTISREQIASLSPDLVVTNYVMTPEGPADPLVEWLESNRIPVVFSDASSNADDPPAPQDPLALPKSQLRLWGQLLGAGAQAEAYIAFMDAHLRDLRERLDGAAPVTTYLEIQSTGDDCCWAAGRRIWGDLLAMAGGRPLPAVTAPWFQKLPLEYLIATPHEVYIASGGGWAAGGRPPIGPGLDPVAARTALAALTRRTGFDQMASVREDRVHAIWTGLIAAAPLNILFIELVATWLHPERCAGLDPARTLTEINRFMAVPIDGPLWVSLREGD